jgi:hypothetical protein
MVTHVLAFVLVRVSQTRAGDERAAKAASMHLHRSFQSGTFVVRVVQASQRIFSES